MNTSLRPVIGLMAAAVVLITSAAHAGQALINVQFRGNDNFGSWSDLQTGAAATGTAGDTWNGLANSGALTSGVSLVDSGNLASGVTLTVTPDSGYSLSMFSFGPGSSSPPLQSTSVANLYQGVLNAGYTGSPNHGSTFVFSGLTLGASYNVYIYSAFNNTSRASSWSLNGGSALQVGPQTVTSSLSNPDNYIVLSGVVDGSGLLTLRADPISGELDVNGFQLQQVSAIPEPATYAAFAGGLMLGLAAWKRRRQNAA